ncbi:hypothetical protein BDB00DRAFT_871626 [Zychaea mexicana]|uniref:uncharacterized protein n=1 Tax=Zychaea mexicana TaxID=64656 RepID=UPI0022FE380E|nr:uncharacterized protein BDB00DRAFT_871626 [Zychaea mexicana]KAI9494294.1 hypothetical protein BDB00DRAFT_871626 [Zychaea mexicana]
MLHDHQQTPRRINSLTMRIKAATIALFLVQLYTQALMRFKNHWVKDNTGWDLPQALLSLDFGRVDEFDQLAGIASDPTGSSILSDPPPNHCSHPHRQQDGPIVHQQTRRDSFSFTEFLSNVDLGTVPGTTTSDSSTTYSRGRQCDSGSGVSTFLHQEPLADSTTDIQPSYSTEMGTSRRRPFCGSNELPAPSLCNMENRPAGVGDGCPLNLLDHVQQPLHPSTLESNTAGATQDQGRTDNSDGGSSVLGERHLVSVDPIDGSRSSSASRPSSPHSNNFPLHSLAVDESTLATIRLETLRRRFELNGFSVTAASRQAAELVQASTARTYQRAQYLFIHWGRHFKVDLNRYSVAQLIEFLDLATDTGFAATTILLFKSAVLVFHWDADAIAAARELRDFLTRLKRKAPPVHMNRPPMDLSPSLDFVQAIPSGPTMTLPLLSKKCAFLLAAAAFLRPSDLHWISLSDCRVTEEGNLLLVIIAPKETRQGRRICKELLVHPLPNDPSSCPVQAYCALMDHPSHVGTSSLFVNSRDPSAALAATTLSSYLRSVLHLSPSATTGSRLPSIRSAASDKALRTSVSLD